jgi:DNA-binding MarR family transcriptional regulator
MNEGGRSKTLQHVIEHPPLRNATECRNLIARIQERADSQAWPGKAGASARVVLQALIGIADRAANSTFTASRRQIAVESGLSRKASDAAIRRLVDGGWVSCVRRGRGQWPSRWRLLDDTCGAVDASDGSRDDGVYRANGPLVQPPRHDVWRWAGLGKNGWRIVRALDPEHGVAPSQLATALNIHRSTVWRNLAKLAQHHLAIRDPDGRWRRAKNLDLDQVAQELAVTGTGDRQRKRHRLEQLRHWRKLGLKADPFTGETLEVIEIHLSFVPARKEEIL